jgi:hypothetical protein
MPGRALLSLAYTLCVFALLGCAAPPGAQAIVGPTGQPMAHVHCGGNQGQCFRIAGELCPKGYDIQPVLSGTDGNFLVRCHAAAVVATVAVVPPLKSTPNAIATPVASTPASSIATAPAPTLAPDGPREQPAAQAWPPATEPGPAPNPWAERDKNATAGASSKPSTIDLGY